MAVVSSLVVVRSVTKLLTNWLLLVVVCSSVDDEFGWISFFISDYKLLFDLLLNCFKKWRAYAAS